MTFVLLPGLDGTGDHFSALVDALAPHERALVIPYPSTLEVALDTMVEHVRAMLPSEPFVLVAESFSGPVAITLASQPPPQCRGLVLAATFRRYPRRVPRVLVRAVAPLAATLRPPRWALRVAFTGLDAPLAGEMLASLSTLPHRVLADRYRFLAEVDVADAWKRVSVPVLYLQATRDRAVPAHNAQDLARLRPDLEIVRIDAPHLLLQCAPIEALAAIRDWLERT